MYILFVDMYITFTFGCSAGVTFSSFQVADSIPMDDLDKKLVTSKSESKVKRVTCKSQSAQPKRRPRVLGAQSKKLEAVVIRHDNSDGLERVTRSKSRCKKANGAELPLVSFPPKSRGKGCSVGQAKNSNKNPPFKDLQMRKNGEKKLVSDLDGITDDLPMNSASLLEFDEGSNTCISICSKFFVVVTRLPIRVSLCVCVCVCVCVSLCVCMCLCVCEGCGW